MPSLEHPQTSHGCIDHLKACFDKGESMPQSWYPKRNMNYINQESVVCQKGTPRNILKHPKAMQSKGIF